MSAGGWVVALGVAGAWGVLVRDIEGRMGWAHRSGKSLTLLFLGAVAWTILVMEAFG